jgi:hypothetical protein
MNCPHAELGNLEVEGVRTGESLNGFRDGVDRAERFCDIGSSVNALDRDRNALKRVGVRQKLGVKIGVLD